MATREARMGAAVRSAREAAGLSQRSLGTAMSERGYTWHPATTGRVESGHRGVAATELVDLAQALGTTASDLLGEPTLSQFATGPLGYEIEMGRAWWAADEAVKDLASLRNAADEALARAKERRDDALGRYEAAQRQHLQAQNALEEGGM